MQGTVPRLFAMAVKALKIIRYPGRRFIPGRKGADAISGWGMAITAGVIAKKNMSIYNDFCKIWPGRKAA
jgi:hypothetical protein